MPLAAITLRRSPAEKADPVLAWARPDRYVFAAGACHILAWRFAGRHPELGLKLIHIRPTGGRPGHHMFASDGARAFDFNGWSAEAELVAVNRQASVSETPDWDCELITISGDFETYCRANHHLTADRFPGDVVGRADRFIDDLLGLEADN
jgi:hypothetical protein